MFRKAEVEMYKTMINAQNDSRSIMCKILIENIKRAKDSLVEKPEAEATRHCMMRLNAILYLLERWLKIANET